MRMIIPLPLMTLHLELKRKKDSAPEPAAQQTPVAVDALRPIVGDSDLVALALVALILVSVVALVLAARGSAVA